MEGNDHNMIYRDEKTTELTVTISLAEYRELIETKCKHDELRSEVWQARAKAGELEKELTARKAEISGLASEKTRREKLLILQYNLVFDEQANFYVEPLKRDSATAVSSKASKVEFEE